MIYATLFKLSTLQCTGASVDSNYESIEEVEKSLGPNYCSKNKRMIVYGSDDNRVAFTDGFTLHVDIGDING